MPRRRFRDRFLTPPVARAMFSPLGIMLAGAGAAVGIVAGGGILGAAAAGAAAWAARVAAAVPRDPRAERIDPYALSEPWRGAMRDALEAQRAFREAVAGTQAGPLRERLDAVGARIGDGVGEAWRVARQGHALVAARRRIDTDAARRELAEVDRHRGSAMERTAQALEAQLESAARMDRMVAEARDRLRLTNARLDEAVARAVELSVSGHTVEEARGLDADVEVMVSDLEALRQGLEELG
jgi:hypothetical protein